MHCTYEVYTTQVLVNADGSFYEPWHFKDVTECLLQPDPQGQQVCM